MLGKFTDRWKSSRQNMWNILFLFFTYMRGDFLYYYIQLYIDKSWDACNV